MSNIYYKIVDKFPNEHQILVRYYSDDLQEADLVSAWEADGVTPAKYRTDYVITLPVPTPTGEDLEKIILFNCPTWWFKIKKSVLDDTQDTTLSDISLGTVFTLPLDSPLVSTPAVISPLQLRKALRKAGLFTTVTTFMATQSDEVQETWEYCVAIRRADPLIATLQTALGFTDEQIDDLFRSAAQVS